jgi:hypothetical protein
MDCPENDILLRFVDEEANFIDSAVQHHIEQCNRCQQEMNAIRAVDESVRQLLRSDRLVSVTGDQCPDSIILAAYLDGRLSTAERDLMEQHLSRCNVCLDEIVTAAERSDLLSRNPRSVPTNLIQKAIDLDQARNLPTRPETETTFDIVLRLLEGAVELVKNWGDWVQPLRLPAPAVRGRPPTPRQSGVLLEKEIGRYKVELDIEPMKTMRCQIGIKLNEKDGKTAEDVRVILSAGEHELGSYLTRQGCAIFDEISPGEYGLTVSDRRGSVGTIRLKIAGQS